MPTPRRIDLISALAAVYIIWGSTYLGIRYAIESIPPLLMAGSRFATAGTIILLVSRLRGAGRPDRQEWVNAAITGILLLAVGNGGVAWAEQTVPSGLAALIASAVPIWMTIIDRVRPGGTRPSRPTIFGLILGAAGLVVLFGGDLTSAARTAGDARPAIIVLLLATIGWALGSVMASHVRLPRAPLTAIGAQMTISGGALVFLALAVGEGAAFDPAAVTRRALIAWLYLVTFGSLLGYSAYVWLLRNTTVAMASTHAFVNPLVAIFLGAWLAAEPIDARTLVAMSIIVTGVALIVLNRGRHADTDRPGPTSRIVGPATTHPEHGRNWRTLHGDAADQPRAAAERAVAPPSAAAPRPGAALAAHPASVPPTAPVPAGPTDAVIHHSGSSGRPSPCTDPDR